MEETSNSLLAELKESSSKEAWNRFVSLYVPVLMSWSRRAGATPDEAADIVQDVLCSLVSGIKNFQHDSTKSFRGWLRGVTLNKWRDLCRRKKVTICDHDPAEVAEPIGSSRFWIKEYRQHLVATALRMMKEQFEESTWRACWGVTVEGKSAVEVGRELDLSVGAVYIAKCRVLKHLRQEMAGLLE